MLDEVDISKREFDVFCRSVREFHPTTFIYAINNPPLQDEPLQHTRFVSLTIQNAPSKVFFSLLRSWRHQLFWSRFVSARSGISVPSACHLRWYVRRSVKRSCHGDEKHAVVYRIEVLWYHLRLQKIPGTSRSKFHYLFNLVRVVLCIIHSNAEEESVFSRVKKNLTPQHVSLELDRTLSSILSFQLNRPVGEKCYQYKPSEKVVSRSKKVTQEYNQEHPVQTTAHAKIVTFSRLSKVP